MSFQSMHTNFTAIPSMACTYKNGWHELETYMINIMV